MSALALVLLVLSGILGLPQYFGRFRGRGNRVLYGFAAAQLVLLGASAVLAVAATGAAGPAGPVAAAFSVAAAALGGGPVTVAVLRLSQRADREETGAGAEAAEAAGASAASAASGAAALRGGTWIGLLERTAIAATLWAGWPEGLAVVLAVKGLGRYSELATDGAAERFILGTFASVLWACACTGIGMMIR